MNQAVPALRSKGLCLCNTEKISIYNSYKLFVCIEWIKFLLLLLLITYYKSVNNTEMLSVNMLTILLLFSNKIVIRLRDSVLCLQILICNKTSAFLYQIYDTTASTDFVLKQTNQNMNAHREIKFQ